MANCVTCNARCENASQHRVKTDCVSYISKDYPKPITNADRIRAMTDEELYRFIVGIYSLTIDQYGEPDYRLVVDGNQFRDDKSLIDWLKKEAGPDDPD